MKDLNAELCQILHFVQNEEGTPFNKSLDGVFCSGEAEFHKQSKRLRIIHVQACRAFAESNVEANVRAFMLEDHISHSHSG